MIRDIEVIELKVEDIYPKYNEINVKIDSSIKVKFNSYINKSTVINNIYLLNEENNERVSCVIRSHDDMVELSPKAHLENSRKYKICIPKMGISDILGRKLLVDFSSSFYTDHNKYVSKPNILEPSNSIYSSNPKVRLSCENDSCILEISNSKSFNLIQYSKLIECTDLIEINHNIETKLDDGLYYMRVKTDENVFSDIVQFYISSGEGRVSNEDIDGTEVFDLEIDQKPDLIEFSPNKVIVDSNLKNIHYKFKGKISEEHIIECKHSIKSTFIDSTNSNIKSHNHVDYRMIYIYDPGEDCTYLIFTINEV